MERSQRNKFFLKKKVDRRQWIGINVNNFFLNILRTLVVVFMLDHRTKDKEFDRKRCFEYCKNLLIQYDLIAESTMTMEGFDQFVGDVDQFDIPDGQIKNAPGYKLIFDKLFSPGTNVNLIRSTKDLICNSNVPELEALESLIKSYQADNNGALKVHGKNKDKDGLAVTIVSDLTFKSLITLLKYHLVETDAIATKPRGRPKKNVPPQRIGVEAINERMSMMCIDGEVLSRTNAGAAEDVGAAVPEKTTIIHRSNPHRGARDIAHIGKTR